MPAEFEAVQIAGPFEFPWSIAFLPNGSILLTERVGRLQLIRPGSSAREITGVPPVLFSGHSGLLDVSVDPGFGENGIIYLSYVHGTVSSSTIRVLRAKLDEPRSKLKNKQVIFESSPPAPSPNQLGGRIAVAGDGYLFLTLGDRWEGERAQDLADHAGSIIGIGTDGSVPRDNPFVSLPEAKPEIWSYGHRNPQGLALHARSGQLWSHEHGPKGGDELNLIISGRNYGWPVVTHGVGYADERLARVLPSTVWSSPFFIGPPRLLRRDWLSKVSTVSPDSGLARSLEKRWSNWTWRRGGSPPNGVYSMANLVASSTCASTPTTLYTLFCMVLPGMLPARAARRTGTRRDGPGVEREAQGSPLTIV